MRQFLSISILLFFSVKCFAQFDLKVNIAQDDKVSFTLNGASVRDTAKANLVSSGNIIEMTNKKKVNKYRISMRNAMENNAGFTFTFGKASQTSFVDGMIKKTFNKGELFDGSRALSLSMSVQVFDDGDREIGRLIVVGNSEETEADKDKGKDAPVLTKIAFYDAINLNSAEITQADYIRILSYYAGSSTDMSPAALAAAYNGNPFINAAFVSKSTFTNPSPNASGGALSSFPPSFIGGLDVTNIADGIARFLIKRGKEEINAAFFGRLKKFLDKEKEFQTLFPSSYDFLENISSYQYAEFIQSLREAFQKDLSNLVVNLNLFIELPKYKDLLENLPEIRLAIRSAKIVSELSQSPKGILPDSIIHQLAGLNELEEIHPNLGASWKLLDLLSQSLRNKESLVVEDVNRWITLSDFNQQLIGIELNRKIYLGLIYQQGKGIKFHAKEGDVTLGEFLTKNSDQILKLMSHAENFTTLANDVDRTIKDLREKLKDHRLTDEDYYSYINKTINLTEYGFTLAQYIKPGINADPYIKIARNGNELYKDIYTKNYSSAVMDVYNILDQLFNKREELGQDRIDRTASLSDGQKKVITAAVDKKNDLPDQKVINNFLTYANFIASVVKAETPEEVESAIEAAALPAGSYSIKQRSLFNFGLNGYIGYAWDFNGGLYAKGIYAPVGVTLSCGLDNGRGGALSALVSLIDVGGIATYRLESGNTDALKQEVRLESIFSPSIQVVYSIPKWPLAICTGYRRTPKLFYSNQTEFTAVQSKSVFNVAVLIDIPILNFINRPFNTKK